MVTNSATGREAGRPRLYQDEDIFRATSDVVSQYGLHRLTLGAVAERLGCTAQALIRRFGSKQGLLLKHLVWVTDESAASFARLRDAYDSPLEAFRAGYVSPHSPERLALSSPGSYANLRLFSIEAALDPVLREELDRRQRVYRDNMASSIRAAVAVGELTGCDPEDVAFLLLAAGSGVMHQWTSDQVGHPREQIARIFDTVIAPYLTERSRPSETDRSSPPATGGDGAQATIRAHTEESSHVTIG